MWHAGIVPLGSHEAAPEAGCAKASFGGALYAEGVGPNSVRGIRAR
jgi:hypothetical protein